MKYAHLGSTVFFPKPSTLKTRSSGLWRHVVLWEDSDVSEDLDSSFFKLIMETATSYTLSKSRGPRFESSRPWKPKISPCAISFSGVQCLFIPVLLWFYKFLQRRRIKIKVEDDLPEPLWHLEYCIRLVCLHFKNIARRSGFYMAYFKHAPFGIGTRLPS
jgi:hypothetical protein